MKEQLTNKYSIEKTLINTLIPIGKTEENFNLLLESDKKRAENYKVVKKIMDRFHKDFIEDVLSKFILENDSLKKYSDLYYRKDKTDKEKEAMNGLETKLRKSVAKALTNDERYSKLNKKEFVEELLPSYLTDEEEKKAVEEFHNFTTYFQGFWDNRENMYTDKEQSTAISYRCINDNLPKFLDNVKSFEKVAEKLPAETLETLNENFSGLCKTKIEGVFCIYYFTSVLSQSGIERYNEIIGGYPTSDGQKVQGLNESINLYNQSVAKNDKSKRLPLMKPLFKQILSDKDSISFIIPESFKDDNEVLKSINTFYNSTENVFDETARLFEEFETYNLNLIYISNGEDLTTISKKLFDSWNVVTNNWNSEYEQTHICKKGKEEKFYEQEKKDFKKIKSFSLSEIQRLGKDDKKNIEEYFKNTIISLVKDVKNSFASIKELVSNPYQSNVRLASNESELEKIKTFLDSVKELERTMKILCGTGKEEEKDNTFYGKFLPLFEEVKKVDTLYNKVRNYLTQKPYSNDKIKLNFENPQFLGGWDRNKEKDYRSVLLKKR